MIYTRIVILISLLFYPDIHAQDSSNKIPLISIQYADSYKYDLGNKTYTVFFMNNTKQQIQFELTKSEIQNINEKWEMLNLTRYLSDTSLPNHLVIKDECPGIPKLMTVVQFQFGHKTITVEIDEYCKTYHKVKGINPSDLLAFIETATKTIQAKPRVKAAPKSNIFYE